MTRIKHCRPTQVLPRIRRSWSQRNKLERSKLVRNMSEAPMGEVAARKGRVTIVDVARTAGVSKSTVSLVLSGSQLVAEATRERVTRAMRALGYVYHRGAASLRAS